MPHDRLEQALGSALDEFAASGRRKGRETVFVGVVPAAAGKGPRYLLEGEGERPFLRMNANGYLGLALTEELIAAEEAAVRRYGTGPGAVRFISGTWAPHTALERRLAAFHDRPAAMIFSSAYATIMGVLVPLIDGETAVISDALNHNCIINAMRLARPKVKSVYPHLDMGALAAQLGEAARTCRRAIVVTDGIFSMRGDHAPLDQVIAAAHAHDDAFAENVIVVADDSHGVGAIGVTGRGTEEHTASGPVDLLVATLGKAFGVNGGYVVGSATIVDYLRETSPFYIYSNPITPGEAAAATRRRGPGRRAAWAGPLGASAGHDRALRGRADAARLRDHPWRASDRAAARARHGEDVGAGGASAGRRHPGDRPQLPRRAARRRGDPLPDLRRPYRGRHRRGAGGARRLLTDRPRVTASGPDGRGACPRAEIASRPATRPAQDAKHLDDFIAHAVDGGEGRIGDYELAGGGFPGVCRGPGKRPALPPLR